MAFVLNNIDELVKEKITQKLSSYQRTIVGGDDFNIQEVIPYCLFSNKTFQSKIHKITSEERETYKARLFTLINSTAGGSEPTEEQTNEMLANIFDDETITSSNLDEKFPKFSFGNLETLLANIYRINIEIFNVFETADDSEKINLDDVFYNLSTVDNSKLIPANYVRVEDEAKYYSYPGPYCGTLSVYHDGEQNSYPNPLTSSINEDFENFTADSTITKFLKMLLTLLFTTRQYNSLDTTKFFYGEMTDESYYVNFNNENFAKYSNCVFEDLKNESNNFDIDKSFDGYDNYQSSDVLVSVADAINDCAKFATFLTNLFMYELSINLPAKYPNLMSNTKLLGHMEGFDKISQDIRSTFKVIIEIMNNGLNQDGADSPKSIPSYNEYDVICKESVKEVIEDLITEHLGKTKPSNN